MTYRTTRAFERTFYRNTAPIVTRPLIERERVALPNHLTYCDDQRALGKCSESHERRKAVACIDADD